MAILDAPYVDGNLIRQISRYRPDPNIVWKKNDPFLATLRLASSSKYDSSVCIWWEDVEGHKYPMMFSDFMELVENRDIHFGRTRRELWIIKKRGTVYGIALAEPDNKDFHA